MIMACWAKPFRSRLLLHQSLKLLPRHWTDRCVINVWMPAFSTTYLQKLWAMSHNPSFHLWQSAVAFQLAWEVVQSLCGLTWNEMLCIGWLGVLSAVTDGLDWLWQMGSTFARITFFPGKEQHYWENDCLTVGSFGMICFYKRHQIRVALHNLSYDADSLFNLSSSCSCTIVISCNQIHLLQSVLNCTVRVITIMPTFCLSWSMPALAPS